MRKSVKKFIHVVRDPRRLWTALEERGFFNWMPDRLFLQTKYVCRMGKKLDLEHPKTFNEKLQWLKLHDRQSAYIRMVDKVSVKDYVADLIGAEYVIPTLQVWSRPDEIDFSRLPEQFVLKCNHDSGSVVICRDRAQFSEKEAIRKLRKGQRRNGFWYGREWPYRDVPCRILAEQYLEEADGQLTDYKVHCFHGVPKLILVCADRNGKNGEATYDFYNTAWERLPIRRPQHPNAKHEIPRPEKLDEMLHLAAKLSEGIPFLRTDFYVIGEKIYFGELTFYPMSGFSPFIPEQWDDKIGSFLKLPDGE